MCWNLLEMVSIPSILDSDKTENVSSAFSTSMICNTNGMSDFVNISIFSCKNQSENRTKADKGCLRK